MIFGTLFLLFNLAYVQLLLRPDGGCDFSERLSSQQLISFKNPHWPATYAPGTTCRWTFECPIWYACRLRCLDVGLPQTDDCYMDKLMVSGEGNPQLEGAQVFCGRTEINLRSVGSKLTLALTTSRFSPGGRFRCTVKAEPWTQPWFMSPCTPNPTLAKRNSISPEKGKLLPKLKNMTSVLTNHRRFYSDLPHTGLIQSRKLYPEKELERNPHLKNDKTESLYYEDRVKTNSTYVEKQQRQISRTADSMNANRIKGKLFSANLERGLSYAKNIQAGSPYLDIVEDGSPRLQNTEIRIPHLRHIKAESPSENVDQVEHEAPHAEDAEPKISHVKAEPQYGDRLLPQIISGLPYLENVEDFAAQTENGQEESPHIQHVQAETSPSDSADPHIKKDQPYLYDNVEEELSSANDVEANATHVRRAKAALPHYKNFKPRPRLDSQYFESVKQGVPHAKDILVKSPYVKSLSAESPNPESFQIRKKIHHVVDVTPHIQKVRSRTPRLRRIKSGSPSAVSYIPNKKSALPYADNINPDQKLDLPYPDNTQEGNEAMEPEPVRPKRVKVRLPYDSRVAPQESHRKHKVVSHVKRYHESKHRSLKHVQKASRHVRQGIKRTPSQAKHLPSGLTRLTHQQPGLLHARRVRTHIKRATKRPPLAPYIGEKPRAYF